jgi:hypothetical protein
MRFIGEDLARSSALSNSASEAVGSLVIVVESLALKPPAPSTLILPAATRMTRAQSLVHS